MKIFNLIYVMLSANIMYAAEPISIWQSEKMPGNGAKEAEVNKFPERTDATRMTNVSNPTLTLFLLEKNDKPAPLVIICPGGGYSYVVVDKEGYEVAKWLNQNGIAAAVLKYRVPNNRAGAFSDLQRAIRLVRAHEKEWQVDVKKVGVMGFSAGGHLAARASITFAKNAYEATDEVDKMSCRPDFAVLVYPAYLDDAGRNETPLFESLENIPPTLMVHSEDDKKYVSGSIAYDKALTEKKIAHKFLLYKTGGHGYALHCEREAKAWAGEAEKWFAEQKIK